jgi:hypothetical protein
MADESLGYLVQLKGVWFTPCSAHLLELFGHMYSVMLYLFDSEFGYLMVLKSRFRGLTMEVRFWVIGEQLM